MLVQIRRIFSKLTSAFKKNRTDSGEIRIEPLIEEMEELIYKNRIKLIENEGLIDKIERDSLKEEKRIYAEDNDVLKRCSLRRIKGYRKRIELLQQCSTILNDNINVHTEMMERLEDMRVSGMKNITAEMLEEIALDNQEMYRKHEEIIDAASLFKDIIEDDKDLEMLAKELGL